MNRIKELRQEKQETQEVLAKLLGLEIAGFSKLETGRVPLKDEYIIKLANHFNVSTDYLLGNSNDKTSKILSIEDDNLTLDIKLKDIPPLTPEKKKWLESVVKTLLKGDDK